MARLGRGRREGARISRAKPVPTPTTLVRKRLVQTPVSNDRAGTVARFWRRKRAHVLLRAPLPFLRGRQAQPLGSRADVRATARVRFFQPRGARIVRAVSTPTVTPLVRKRVVVETTVVSRSRVVARLRRRKPLVLRAPMPQPAPFVRPKIVVSRVRARVRYTRGHSAAIVLRAPIAPLATRTIPRILVVRRQRAATVRGYFGRRRLHLETSTFGVAVAAPIVTAFFGQPDPTDAGLGGGPAAALIGGTLDDGGFVGAASANTFGPSSPGRS